MMKTNEQIKPIVEMKDETLKLEDTSKKIRHLISNGYTVKEIYQIFKVWGITTKSGGEIRYQHVRNVAITPVGK